MATDTTSLTEKKDTEKNDTGATGETDTPRGKKSAAARTAPVARRKQAKRPSATRDSKTVGHNTDTDTDTSSDVAPERGRPRALIISAVSLLFVILIGVVGFFAYQFLSDDDASSAAAPSTAEAIDTAKDYAIKLSSFDYRDLNKNRAAIAAMSTPEFAAKYSQMVTDLTQIVTDGKGEATATVSHAAAEQVSATDATVMLFVDQQARNVVAPTGKTQAYRMVVKLKNSNGHWLVDDIQTK
ncbi:hypothetical protein [Gordonia sp. NPDC003585]|uniref:hypothetical protein n=1 Tax=Gordonia sp. NPDC003585 TaxID=3154275 RepID=UPI0033BEBFD3